MANRRALHVFVGVGNGRQLRAQREEEDMEGNASRGGSLSVAALPRESAAQAGWPAEKVGLAVRAEEAGERSAHVSVGIVPLLHW